MWLKLQMDNFCEFIATEIYNLTLIGLLIPSIILFVAVCLGWMATTGGLRRRKGKVPMVHHVLSRSLSLGVLHGGQLAIQRLVDYHDARADRTLSKGVEEEFDALLAEERPRFKKLQRVGAKLEMSGKEDKAIERLETALAKAWTDGKSHEAYEFEMLLVEMLIYKGEFERALQFNCLTHEHITDARRPLYKAIIYIMLDRPKEARKFWKEFKVIRREFTWVPASSSLGAHEIVRSFSKFEKVVKLLKNDIHEALQKPATE